MEVERKRNRAEPAFRVEMNFAPLRVGPVRVRVGSRALCLSLNNSAVTQFERPLSEGKVGQRGRERSRRIEAAEGSIQPGNSRGATP